MNNINQSPQPSLDQINEFKQQCQDLMPLVNLLKNKSAPNTLSGLERDQKLAIMGYSIEQIEEMTGFKNDAYPLLPGLQTSEEARVRAVGEEVWKKMKEVELKNRQEWELEYNRLLQSGMALGWIEEEFETRPSIDSQVHSYT